MVIIGLVVEEIVIVMAIAIVLGIGLVVLEIRN